jgi:hypothetical protein
VRCEVHAGTRRRRGEPVVMSAGRPVSTSLDSSGAERPSPPGCRSRPVEAGGSLIRETPGMAGAAPTTTGHAASSDYVVGSVHALTEGGSLPIASASVRQLGPLMSGAGQVMHRR